MPRYTQARAVAVFLFAFTTIVTAQSVYPTGTTIYDPERAWNGYTVLSPLRTQAVIVIDMNGNVVKQWDGYRQFRRWSRPHISERRRHGAAGNNRRIRNRSNWFSGISKAMSSGASITTANPNAWRQRSGRHGNTTTGSGRIFRPAIIRQAVRPGSGQQDTDTHPHQPYPARRRRTSRSKTIA